MTIYENTTVFDLETTGLNRKIDKPIEIAAIKIVNGEKVASYSELCNPGFKIDARITTLTGISFEMVESCRSSEEVTASFVEFAGDSLLIAHNAAFDMGFVNEFMVSHDMGELMNNFLDTRAMAMKRFPFQKHKLENLCEYLNIKLTGAHRALNDVEATWEVAKALSSDPMVNYKDLINKIYHFAKYANDPPFVPSHGKLVLI